MQKHVCISCFIVLKCCIYCGGSAGVILTVGFLYCACEQFRKRRQNPNTAVTNVKNNNLRASVKENQQASEQKKCMHIYHTIDDNILGDENTNCYAFSEVKIAPISQKCQAHGTEAGKTLNIHNNTKV